MNTKVQKVFILALLARLSASGLFYMTSINLPCEGAFVGRDDYFFLNQGRDLGALLSFGDVSWVISVPHVYYIISGVISFCFGNWDLPVLLLLVSIVGACTVFPIHSLSKAFAVDAHDIGLMACIFVAFHPRLVFWSSLNFRDAYVALFLAISMVMAIRYIAEGGVKLLITFYVAICLYILFRPWQGIIVLVIVLLSIVYGKRSMNAVSEGRSDVFAWRQFILGMIAVFAISSLVAPLLLAKYVDLNTLAMESRISSDTGGVVLARFMTYSMGDRLLMSPVGITSALISPFPFWRLKDFHDVNTIASVINWFYYPLLPFMVVGFLKVLKSKPFYAMVFLGYLSAVMVPEAMVTGFGSPRTISPVLPILFLLSIIGIKYTEHKCVVLGGGILFIGVLSFLYLSLA